MKKQLTASEMGKLSWEKQKHTKDMKALSLLAQKARKKKKLLRDKLTKSKKTVKPKTVENSKKRLA